MQSSMTDFIAKGIAKNTDLPSCRPASEEQQFFSDAPKGMEISVHNKPLQVAAKAKEAQLSESAISGRRHHSEKAVLEVSPVCQMKKGGNQSGIMDFLTVQEKKQKPNQDESSIGSSKRRAMQTISEVLLHRSTRMKEPLNEKDEGTIVSTMNLCSTNTECEGYALRKEDSKKLPLLNPTGIKYNQDSEHTQNDFFLPASKKCRLQRVPEAANAFISDCIMARKNDGLGLRGYGLREERIAEAKNGSAVSISKQPSKNEDFFRPASEKQKQKMAKETTMKFGSLTKAQIRDESYLEYDLQMEAKLASEENAQLCAGKPIHPFFFQHKIGERPLSLCGTVGDASFTPRISILEIEDLTPAPPFHVNQLPERECEAGSRMESFTPTLLERKKGQCAFRVEHPEKSMQELGMLLKRPFLGRSCKTSRSISQSVREQKPNEPLEDNVLKRLVMFLKDLEKDSKHEEKGEEDKFAFTEVGLEERLKLYRSDQAKGCSGGSLDFISSCTEAGCTSRNLLWTDVYQPHLPEQVCGNKESVQFLSTWLQSWQTRNAALMGSSEGDMSHRRVANDDVSDEDRACSEEDSDCSENSSHDYLLQNVLVLTGPVGCGKTAAIYACAKAHGYTIIEVNCSDNRSGTLIKQKFGESMESHRLGKWSADATVAPLTKRGFYAKSDVCIGNTFVTGSKKREQVDGQENCTIVAANSDFEHSDQRQPPSKSTHSDAEAKMLREDGASRDNKDMTILLFEDVDLVFEDDQGFMAAVAQVATSAKRPIILTSNDKEPSLPHGLYAHQLEFKRLSTKDLVSLAYLVCIAEGIICSPELLQHVVIMSNHDARKVLNYLQFWCQQQCHASPQQTEFKPENGRVAKNEKESGMPSSVRPQESDSAEITNLFNLEAQHRLWPAYIYQDFPCEVTKSVACRLNEVISETETNHGAHKEKRLAQEVVKKRVLLDKMKRRLIDSPPKAGVDHAYEWEGEDNTDGTVITEEFSFSNSPVKFCREAETMAQSPVLRRKIRRQFAIVMSDSDDDTPRGAHEEQLHQDKSHLPMMQDCSSSLVSVRTTEDMGPINESSIKNEEMTPFSSDLHVEASTMHAGAQDNATQTSETRSKSFPLDCPLEELRSNQAAPHSFPNTSEPVYNLWSHFWNCSRSKEGLLLSTASKESFSLVLSLSDLSDNLSACDIMSCVHSSEQGIEKDAFKSSSCENHECRSAAQVCAQVAHKSFEMCFRESLTVSGIMEEISDTLSLEDMMLAMSDPFKVGKLAADETLNHHAGYVHGLAGPSCQEQELIRLQKRYYLQHSISMELPPRTQQFFHGASFYEFVSFLARMAHLKQDSLASGSTRRSRARGYQRHFHSHLWNLSEGSITFLQSFGSFGNPLNCTVRVG